MLRIPSFRKIGDLTVYQDDGVWNRFYPIASIPTIRRDENGRPIFLLTIFHTSDQARETNPALARGGGFMNFDVQFAVSEESREAARTELQQWVNDEYARRRADPRYANLAEYAAASAPAVELADPLLSSGTVSMHTTQSNLLVTGRFAEAPASLVSGSTAVFNLDLTENGAGFMKELFVDSSGGGRVDLTPVQVIYNLKMWARLPAITITVTGQSERIQQTLKKISQSNRDDPCTPAEVETFRDTGTNSSTLRETGLVDVKIDKGDATVPDDVLEALQKYALDLFDTMIAQRFLVPAETDGQQLEFDSDDPQVKDRDPGWGAVLCEGPNYTGRTIEVNEDISSVGQDLNDRIASVRVRSGHRLTLYQHINYGGVSTQLSSSVSQLGGNWDKNVSSAKLWRPPTTRYKVRETLNTATMNLQIKVDRSQVVEWPLVGQATLETFFSKASPDEIRRHVVELTADQFDSLGVTVRALVDFDKQPVQAIEVQTEYTGTDGDGQSRTTPGSFTFRSGETAPAKFDPTVLGGKREYRFRYRVIYDDGTAGDYTEWESTTNRSLNVTVPNAGQHQPGGERRGSQLGRRAHRRGDAAVRRARGRHRTRREEPRAHQAESRREVGAAGAQGAGKHHRRHHLLSRRRQGDRRWNADPRCHEYALRRPPTAGRRAEREPRAVGRLERRRSGRRLPQVRRGRREKLRQGVPVQVARSVRGMGGAAARSDPAHLPVPDGGCLQEWQRRDLCLGDEDRRPGGADQREGRSQAQDQHPVESRRLHAHAGGESHRVVWRSAADGELHGPGSERGAVSRRGGWSPRIRLRDHVVQPERRSLFRRAAQRRHRALHSRARNCPRSGSST